MNTGRKIAIPIAPRIEHSNHAGKLAPATLITGSQLASARTGSAIVEGRSLILIDSWIIIMLSSDQTMTERNWRRNVEI